MREYSEVNFDELIKGEDIDKDGELVRLSRTAHTPISSSKQYPG